MFETGGGGWGNNEKQYYQAANATVANGELQITARKQSVGGYALHLGPPENPGAEASSPSAGWRPASRCPWARACGRPSGCWAANINTVSWPQCGEIDMMEHVNADNRCYGTVHWDSNGHAQYGGNISHHARRLPRVQRGVDAHLHPLVCGRRASTTKSTSPTAWAAPRSSSARSSCC